MSRFPLPRWCHAMISLVTCAFLVGATNAPDTIPPSRLAGRLVGTFEGIEFEYSPGQEELARLLAHRIVEHQAQRAAGSEGRVPGPTPAVPLTPAEMKAHQADYLRHIAALLGLPKATPLQEECYGEFLRNYALRMQLYDTMRDYLATVDIGRRVTLWDRAELVDRLQAGEQIRGFTWDPVTKQGGVTFGVDQQWNDDRFKALVEQRKQLHRAYRLSVTSGKDRTVYRGTVAPLAAAGAKPEKPAGPAPRKDQVLKSELLPVVIPAELSGKPADAVAQALWNTGSMPIAKMLDVFQETADQLPTVDPKLAFIVLHETAELGIVENYMHGPDRRWFCDGAANYTTWRVIRDLHGEVVANSAYDLEQELAKYAAQREQADLRRWPTVENEDESDRESDLELARYAYATYAVALMNERAGEDILPKLFSEIGRTPADQVNITTVAKAWTKLTGKPLGEIVAAAMGSDEPIRDEDLVDQSVATGGTTSLSLGLSIRLSGSRKTGQVKKVTITKIEPGSFAEQAGLRAGDRIVAINAEPLAGKKFAEVRKLLVLQMEQTRSTTHHLRIQRGLFHKESTVTLTLPSAAAAAPKL